KSRSFIADWDARKASHSTKRAGSMWRLRSRDVKASCESIPTVPPTCSFPARASWAWRLRHRAASWWPQPTQSIEWTQELKAYHWSDGRRDHCSRLRDVDAAAHRHQFAVPHRRVEQSGRGGQNQIRDRG